jgi:hypothetical protein
MNLKTTKKPIFVVPRFFVDKFIKSDPALADEFIALGLHSPRPQEGDGFR